MSGIFHLSFNQNPPGCRNATVPHTHKHHELLYATAGEGGQVAEHRELPLRAGELFFYPAGTQHCSIFLPGKSFECFVLSFESRLFTPALTADREVLDVVDKMARFRGKVPLSAGGGQAVASILEELRGEFQRKDAAYHAVLKMLSMRLMIAVARDEEFHRQGRRICPSPSNDDMIREVIGYLEAFYMDDVTVDSILDFCPISRSHFHAVFKRSTGRTLVEYLTAIRVEKARQLLAGTDAPIAVVASHTGLRTSSYFGQVFRAATGLSPSQYRRRHTAGR